MATKNTIDWHGCPARYCAAVFGDQWTLLIVRGLLIKRFRHYADFLNEQEGLSTNILAARLLHLEKEGMVTKTSDPDHGARKIYAPTEKAIQLIPMILEMIDWAERWDDKTEVPASFILDLRKDRAEFAKRLMDMHRK